MTKRVCDGMDLLVVNNSVRYIKALSMSDEAFFYFHFLVLERIDEGLYLVDS